MARDNGPEMQLKRARERLTDTQGYIRDFSLAIDPDTSRAGPKKSVRTAATYTNSLRRFENKAGGSLLELDTEGVIEAIEEIDRELSDNSVSQYQSAVKGFYRWYDGNGHSVEPEEIAVKRTSDSTGIDETKVLTGEEFHALREAANHPRSRCIIDLLGYTGQRIRVIQTLRVKDVNPEEGGTGTYRVNAEADGLKGAEKAMSKRPLLGAQRSVIDWLDDHPTKRDNDYLITPLDHPGRGNPGEMVAQNTIRRALKRAADRAGIDKPVNPHSFRHFFATAAKRDYDMDPDDIRALLGHGPTSRIMETTYRHLSDDDIIRDVETDFGVEPEEAEAESPLTPPSCPTCREPLPSNARACSKCGTVFTPDAAAAKQEAQEKGEEMVIEAENEAEAKIVQSVLREIREKPQEYFEEQD